MGAERPLNVGLVGCGAIAGIYARNARLFADIVLVACASRSPEAAGRFAEAHGIRAMETRALLADPGIDLVLNLTPPDGHAEIAAAALAAGKHVYNEKPLATALPDGRRLVDEAEHRGLRLGAAPDTILGAGLQVARMAVDAGELGPVLTGLAAFMTKGMEHWHPNAPAFYGKGIGPVMDIGPYYVAALTTLLGPVESVQAAGRISPAERRRGAPGPLQGTPFTAEAFTSVNAILHFASGAQVSLLASWDVWAHGARPIELHGTLGSIRVPDPNTFGGAVERSANHRLLNMHDPADAALIGTRQDWLVQPVDGLPFGAPNYPADGPRTANYRGLGLAEMANAIRSGRPHRCSGQFALHTLAVLLAIGEAAGTGRRAEVAVMPTAIPAPFPPAEAASLCRNAA